MDARKPDHISIKTIESLEQRLRRLQFLLTGTEDVYERSQSDEGKQSVQSRLQRLEESMVKLSNTSSAVSDLLRLYHGHADIFLSKYESDEDLTTTQAERLTIVTACATSYHTTVSQLKSIKDFPIPATEPLAALVELSPRLVAAEDKQSEQESQLESLRARSAALLERWYETGVTATSECWAEWEDRVMAVEKTLRREEGFRDRQARDV